MVEVMKIIETSFKRFHAHTAAISASDPTAGHRRPTPLPETPGHSQASLAQSIVGSLLLSPGSCCVQGFVCALEESVSPVLCKFWRLYGGVNGNLLQEGLCHTQVYCTQSPCLCGRPLLTHTSTGDTQTQFWLSLCGIPGSQWHKVCLSPLSISGQYGVDSKRACAPPTILPGLLLCLWTWGIFLVEANIFLLMVVQQQVVILEFSQKISTCPYQLLIMIYFTKEGRPPRRQKTIIPFMFGVSARVQIYRRQRKNSC